MPRLTPKTVVVKPIFFLALIMLVDLPTLTHGLNTIEQLGVNSDYTEIHMGIANPGQGKGKGEISTQGELGRGLSDYLTGYFGMGIASSEMFTGVTPSLSLGLVWSPIIKDRYSLNFWSDAEASDTALGAFSFTPGVEFVMHSNENHDGKGLYINTAFTFSGADTSLGEDDPWTVGIDESKPDPRRKMSGYAMLGGYWNIITHGQMHLQFENNYDFKNVPAKTKKWQGVFSIGWNQLLTETLELNFESRTEFYKKFTGVNAGVFLGFTKWR